MAPSICKTKPLNSRGFIFYGSAARAYDLILKSILNILPFSDQINHLIHKSAFSDLLKKI